MALINENYLRLGGGYLFPEIGRRIEAFLARHPQAEARLIHCGIGDVTEPLPPAAVEALHEAADEMGRAETFRGYGPAAGYPFLRETIAEHDFRARGLDVEPSEIFVSDGAKGDCGHVLEIIASGSRVAVANPVYPVYADAGVMAGNDLSYLPCTPDNDFIPPPPPQPPDVVYLCFPNNPTGAMIDRDRLRAWVDYALEHDVLILYDAAYAAYVRDADLPRSIYEVDGARRCAIEFHSFSKDGGFTGLRCGYTVCPRSVEGATSQRRRVAFHDLWTRRWNTRSNGVPYVVQRAAEALYAPDGRRQVRQRVEHYLANADLLREGCRAAGWEVYGGRDAPYVWVACPDGAASWATFDRLLADAQVVVVPGAGFGDCGEGFVRISAFNTRANVEEVVARLRALSPAAAR